MFEEEFIICSSVVPQVASFMTVWNQFQPDYAANLWNEALNKRLGTQAYIHIYIEHPQLMCHHCWYNFFVVFDAGT